MELPFDHEIERAIIGKCLLDTEAFIYAISCVTKEYFTNPLYVAIWAAMEEINEDGKEVDQLIIRQKVAKSLKESPQDVLKKINLTLHDLPRAKIETWVSYGKDFKDRRAIMNICQEAINQAAIMPTQDFFQEFQDELLEVQLSAQGIKTAEVAGRIDRAIQRIEEGRSNKGISGIPVGLDAIDLVTGGWQPGLHLIAARSGSGKTEIANAWAAYISRTSPCYFSQNEMSEDQSTMREFTVETGIRYSKMQRSDVSEWDLKQIREAGERLKSRQLYLDAKAMSIGEIIGKIKYYKKKYGIVIVFIDYIQIVEFSQSKNETRDQVIGKASRKLKQLANELKIPIIVLAQLGRAVDARPFGRPLVTDLRESGDLENAADTVILMYYADNFRDSYKDKKGNDTFTEPNSGLPLDGVLEFIWAKNRAGTPNLSTFCRWNKGTVKFTDIPEMNKGLTKQPVQSEAF